MKRLLFFLSIFSPMAITSITPKIIYGHGIVDGPGQAQRFAQAFSPGSEIVAVKFADASAPTDWYLNGCLGRLVHTLIGKPFNRACMYMATGPDIKVLQEAIEKQPKTQSLIGYACSRGAAAFWQVMAHINPENMKALILDASPASMPDTIKPLLAKLGIRPNHAQTVFSTFFPAFDPHEQTPLAAIAKISNKNLPILLLHSKTDTKVPLTHSMQLYLELKTQGFTNVELAILPSGKHSYLLQDDTSKDQYLHAVHSFYKKHGMAYDSSYIQPTQTALPCPSDEELRAEIHAFEKQLQENFAWACKRNTAVIATGFACVLAKYNLPQTIALFNARAA
jgi:hypothetical protein